ncbi:MULTISPECIES: hypothetical protein [Sphingomonadales]|jgi:hypothetical protein|uniref:hypothetical protein n=2 Tax=Alphaproteobacteria TaxID=28211 RepID=UPI000A563871|nr:MULTISPECIES: hypothetical protein [Sphingomonadales]
MSQVSILLPKFVRSNLDDFIAIADGVEQVWGACPSGEVPYEDGALIPAGEWRLPMPDDRLEISLAPSSSSPFVAMMDLKDVTEPLWTFGCVTRENIKDVRKNAAVEIWYESVLWPYIQEIWGDIDLRYNGANENPPNCITTTVNYRTDKYLGLHLDTWEVIPILDRRGSLYRLCINIGFDDRYFIFGLTPTDEFMTDDYEKYYYSGKLRYSYTDQIRDRAPDFGMRLCRLRIPPGFAYIAPTDLLLHDASTVGVSNFGASFAVRGAFQSSENDWSLD